MALISRFAMRIKEDVPTANRYTQLALAALSEAQRIDQQSKPIEFITDFSYINARLGGDYGPGRYRIEDAC